MADSIDPQSRDASSESADVQPSAIPSVQPAAAGLGSAGAWTGAFNAFGEVFERIKKNPQPAYVFIGVYTALAILSYIANGGGAVSFSSYGQNDTSFESLTVLIFLLALPTYALALADKRVISIAEFMRFDLGRYLTLLAVTILTVVIVFFSALPLLIPLIWTIPWFAFGSYVVVDKKLGVIDSLKESKRLAQNHKGKVWGIVGVMILAMIAVGILSFIPVIGAAMAAGVNVLLGGTFGMLYRWLQHNTTAA